MCENYSITMHYTPSLEPMKGIEPLTTVYKTVVLPLNYIGTTQHSNHFLFWVLRSSRFAAPERSVS